MKLLIKSAFIVSVISALSGYTYGAGDAEVGKAKTAVCGGCHGADGNSVIPNFPKLAGQNESYIVKQLKDMKSGERTVPEMAGFLPGLSEQDMADMGAYYEKQKTTLGGTKPELVELGEKLYRSGNAKSGVTACSACHGAKGDGMAEAGFPKLNGQHTAYLDAQLKAFRAAGRGDHQGKKRTNDGETMMMRSVAANLTDDEIQALSSFITGLH